MSDQEKKKVVGKVKQPDPRGGRQKPYRYAPLPEEGDLTDEEFKKEFHNLFQSVGTGKWNTRGYDNIATSDPDVDSWRPRKGKNSRGEEYDAPEEKKK